MITWEIESSPRGVVEIRVFEENELRVSQNRKSKPGSFWFLGSEKIAIVFFDIQMIA